MISEVVNSDYYNNLTEKLCELNLKEDSVKHFYYSLLECIKCDCVDEDDKKTLIAILQKYYNIMIGLGVQGSEVFDEMDKLLQFQKIIDEEIRKELIQQE
jgi:hypothetical protein